MRPLLRYVLSLVVGVGVTAVTVQVTGTTDPIVWSLLPLYAAATALVVGHADGWARLLRAGRNRGGGQKLGAIGGGVGALTFSLLFSVSIPAGVAGVGLLLFGQALTVADYEAQRGEAPPARTRDGGSAN
ncbi:hypothetical protein [Halopiger xanaduensis]|uniref:DUF8153 domain-containing protein n=1 Tax=Halopiger xanaduensis (strain DSM 18323 / JCM 14033 / SH-6) TaxID=797210 RepID=F8D502_HALXS|nr:hypothetical protein [Halopiger xanaduensis]AEH38763.1 hypothetical protein Halxa_4159 [Halopiger xanaduensis SH-6]